MNQSDRLFTSNNKVDPSFWKVGLTEIFEGREELAEEGKDRNKFKF